MKPDSTKTPKFIKLKPGWLRHINAELKKPITLPKAPWEKESK